MRQDPGDYDVKFYVVSTLSASSLPADQAMALINAQDLVQKYPKKPSAHSLLAYVHYRSWLRTKNPKEASQAITEYQQYLELAPSDEGFRRQVKLYIAQMRNS